MDVLDALAAATADGRTTVLVTVVAVDGDAPSHPGAKLLVTDGTVAAGTLGCSEFDTAGREVATELAGGAEPTTLRRRVLFGHGQDRALDLFAEVYPAPPAVLVVGDNPVGRALITLAQFAGRRAVPVELDPVAALRERPPGPADAVVLTDHDAPYVDAAITEALHGRGGYVGMLGSRRHAPQVVARLRAQGLPEDVLDRLRCPVGLDIGSHTPAEIALSIVADIVAAGHGRDGRRMTRS